MPDHLLAVGSVVEDDIATAAPEVGADGRECHRGRDNLDHELASQPNIWMRI